MSDQIDVLKLVGGRLDEAGIPYMVSGSMAMNFYAQPRMTRDIDLVVDLEPRDATRVAEAFIADFYCDAEAIRSAIARRGFFNLIHFDKLIKVDFIVRRESAFRRVEFDRRRRVVVDGASLWMVTAEDLLLSKLAWARDSRSPVQLGDVRNLMQSADTIDWPYVERWAAELAVVDLLGEMRQ